MIKFPKSIHQIFFGDNNLYLQKYSANIKNLKDLNPDFSYTLWKEEDSIELIISTYPEYYNVYKNLSLMEKTDFFRYVLMYHFGGFYFDLDMEFYRSLTDFFEDHHIYFRNLKGVKKLPDEGLVENFDPMKYDMIFSSENFNQNGMGYVNNYMAIAQPRHPFWKKLLDEICLLPDDLIIYQKTGGIVLSKCLLRYHPENTLILPSFYFGWSDALQCERPSWCVSSHAGDGYSRYKKHLNINMELPKYIYRQIQSFNEQEQFFCNPNFVNYKNKRYLFYRVEIRPYFQYSSIGCVELDLLDVPIEGTAKKIKLTSLFEKGESEDPRLHVYNDRLFVVYNDGYGTAIAELNEEMETIWCQFLNKDHLNKHTNEEMWNRQKNLVPFGSHENGFYIVDWCNNPRTIKKINIFGHGFEFEDFEIPSIELDWNYGEIHNGSNLIEIEYMGQKRYVGFFHSHQITKCPEHWTKLKHEKKYYVGLYMTKSLTDYSIEYYTNKPIVEGRWPDESANVLLACVFPSGISLENGQIVLWYGKNDSSIERKRLTWKEIESKLSNA